MSEVLRGNPELPAPSPIEEISKYCTNLEFDSILLPDEQKRLYNPLLNSLKYAVARDRLYMKYLDYQSTNIVNRRLPSSELFFINKSISREYSVIEIMPEEENEMFRTSHEGWAKKLKIPSIVAVNKNDVPELIIRANYIGGTPYDNFIIPDSRIGAVRFMPDKGRIDELHVDSNKVVYSLQNNFDYRPISDYNTEKLKNILCLTENRLKHEYEQMVKFYSV